jgi:integrase/recombinase XerD
MCPREIEGKLMTPLRQRMLDALELRGHAARTREAYIDAVARLARHYRCSPDALSAEQVQAYLLHLLRDRQLARSSVNQYGCAYRFLYGTVLGLDGDAFQIPLGHATQQLPEILSREEIARLFAAARHSKSRSLLMLAYATGLRLSELTHLRVADIDSAADRMCIRVVQGKGAKCSAEHLAPHVFASFMLRCVLTPWRQLALAVFDVT